MTVYVDDMHLTELGRFGRMRMCHMIADTTEELLAMVDKIGVARKWIQHKGTHREHFDIATSKRALAVKAGAKEITMRRLVMITKGKRQNCPYCGGLRPRGHSSMCGLYNELQTFAKSGSGNDGTATRKKPRKR